MGHAICLGEILIDCFAEQPGRSRSEIKSWTPLPGGASANVACALAKLGNPVEFIGAVGQDHWGRALVKLLGDMKVGHQGVQYRLKAPTREVYVVKDADGDRTFAGFSESDPTVFADAHLFSSAIEPGLFANARFLVLGTLLLAYPDSRESVEQAMTLAANSGAPILVDINWRPMFWPKPIEAPGRIYDLLQRTHFLKVSDDEARWLFGTESALAIAHQLPHLRGVLVTAGERGCQYCFATWTGAKRISGRINGFAVDVEETTGAGDAFTAGFVHQLLHKGLSCLHDERAAHEVVSFASAMGALTTTRPGAIAALPTPSEIEVFLYLN